MSSKGDDSQAIGDDLEATIFAKFFKKYLKKGNLTGIYLKDDRFGNADDIVFELNSNFLHCIQSKGSKSHKEITIGEWFNPHEKKKLSLIQKLYNSFKNMKTYFKKYDFKIELITNRFPSSSTTNLPKEGNRRMTFASFIREIWRPFKNNNLKRETILEDINNQKLITDFSNRLKISEDELWEFFEYFNFKFGYKPKRVRNLDKFRKIEKYYNWYLITKKNPEKKGFFSITTLIKELKLSISPNPHDFPVDEEKYIQFPSLKNEIIEGIGRFRAIIVHLRFKTHELRIRT